MPVSAPAESGILSPVTHRIEEAFVDLLEGDPLLSGLPVFAASDRDGTVPPLHCFVYCDTATPQQPVGPRYLANVAIGLVSNIDDDNTAIRQAWWGKVLQTISRGDQAFTTLDGTNICGWFIKAQGEVSDGQQTGDIARLQVGVFI